MRTFLLTLGGAFVLGACGSTNINQPNYDRIKADYAAAHGGEHGGDHGKADAGHADKADGHAAAAGDASADAGEAHAEAGHDLQAGEKVYNTYCISCHGPDGKGMGGIAANLAEDRTRLAKPTDVLVKNIREGYTGEIGMMPPWGSVVDDTAARNVIAYLRHEYPPE